MRVLILGLLCWPLLAQASALESLVQRLEKLDSLEGRFEQRTRQDGARVQEASGTMVVARPNRFRWHTKKPFEQLVVSDGEQVWVHDPGLEQVVIRPLDQEISKTPALLFGGQPERVGESFTVERRKGEGETVTYRLKPKGQEPLFSHLEVTFDGQRPASMRLRDALGQRTVIEFRDLEINAEPEDERFNFDPPEGSDVIRQQQS
jgi:outer membrane lipoprotein carrier protein